MDPIVQEMHDQSLITAVALIIALAIGIRALIKQIQKFKSAKKEFEILKQEQETLFSEYTN